MFLPDNVCFIGLSHYFLKWLIRLQLTLPVVVKMDDSICITYSDASVTVLECLRICGVKFLHS